MPLTQQVQIQGLAAIQSLSGVAIDAVDLGTFTGVTIPDNQNIKQAFQALETFVEGLPTADQSVVATIAARDALASPANGDLAYVVDASADATVTSGTALYVYDGSAWQKISEFEVQTDVTAILTTIGVAAAATDLGTFTGNIISDNGTVKAGMQELETDVDAIQTILGVAAEAVNFGTFGGTTLSDNETLKNLLQELETAVEAAGVSITPEDVTLAAVAAATNQAVTLTNAIPAGATIGASINGITLARSEIISATGTTLTINVPYATNTSMVITTHTA